MTEEDTKINTSPTESDNGELLPSNFKFHEFVVQVADTSISGHIIGAEDSYYVWVADTASYTMNDLSLAFLAKCNKPVGTKIMGPVSDTTSLHLAERLVKKLGKPIYISFNIKLDNRSLLEVEKKILEEFQRI